jgi:acetyltransferase-like isoleucine patch superfamily enzyme
MIKMIEDILKHLYYHSGNFGKQMVIRICSKMEGGTWKSMTLRKILLEAESKSGGVNSYGWESPNIKGPLTVGNYCSFGPGVRRFQVNHSLDLITTSPFAFNPICGWVNKDTRNYSNLKVGNDVWIGADVIILPNVTEIGNGVIIGAGSIVTKNVPAYAVVAGNPARILRYRFSKEFCNRLENTKWWDLSEETLKELLPLFSNPDEFVDKIESQYLQ